MLNRWLRAGAMSVLALVVCGSPAAAHGPAPTPPGPSGPVRIQSLDFIGEATFETGFLFEGTEVGGLSGIDYDPDADLYYIISDDRVAPRFYEAVIDLADGTLAPGDVVFTDVTTILDTDGGAFAPNTSDPESIRYDARSNTLYWTSEGDANALLPPFVREMDLHGNFLRELTTPALFAPTADQSSGIRNNLAFESLTFSWFGLTLITATENALYQDGPAASLTEGSPARTLELGVFRGRPLTQRVYVTDEIASPPDPAGSFATNGLVEILAHRPGCFLAVERAFSVGVGNTIRLYEACYPGTSNVRHRDSIQDGRPVRTIRKRLLLDLDVLGIPLDNIEGITFGPRLPDGSRSLILVSDNNFNPNGQFTQFLAFRIHERGRRFQR
ncbi:MAG: esterase-like activity of phytase family protein [Sandaracinaceae bacterium]